MCLLSYLRLIIQGLVAEKVMNDLMVKRCYLCGLENADSSDHIPPKNIFLKKNRVGLITVPAHINCNKQYDKDDEYFRYAILIPAYWESKDAIELWNTKIKKHIHRPEKRGFKTYLLEHIKSVGVKTPAGIYLGKSDAAYLDAGRIHNVVQRIARGLFYKHTGNILPLELYLKVDSSLGDSSIRKIRTSKESKNKFISIGNSIFKYHWEKSKENKTGKFWLTFFDCVDFWVYDDLNTAGQVDLK